MEESSFAVAYHKDHLDKESKGRVTIGRTVKKCFVDGERCNCDRSRSKVGGVTDPSSSLSRCG